MTTPEPKVLWTEANQASLSAELARLKRLLGCTTGCTTTGEGWDEAVAFAQPSAIDSLSELFGLSPFERDVLLLCAGVEMDSHLAAPLRRSARPSAASLRHLRVGTVHPPRSPLERADA